MNIRKMTIEYFFLSYQTRISDVKLNLFASKAAQIIFHLTCYRSDITKYDLVRTKKKIVYYGIQGLEERFAIVICVTVVNTIEATSETHLIVIICNIRVGIRL